MYVTVKIRTSTKRWSGIAFSYNLVPRAGPFPSTSIPIEKLKVETRDKCIIFKQPGDFGRGCVTHTTFDN